MTASVTFAIVAAEVALRIFQPWWSDGWKMWRIDPVHARGLRANVRDALVHGHTREFAFRFSTNAQGLRMDAEVAPEPRPGHERILFVGDSFAFGYGVDQGRNFVDWLGARARDQDLPFDFVNAGYASGYTLDTEYLFTRENLDRLGPDHVVVVVCIANDLDDLASTRWRVWASWSARAKGRRRSRSCGIVSRSGSPPSTRSARRSARGRGPRGAVRAVLCDAA